MTGCVAGISTWLQSNRLCLNPQKTEFIWLASPHHIQSGQIPVGDIQFLHTTITPSTSVRNLGFLLDNSLTMSGYVSSVVSACFYQLSQLGKIKNSLNRPQLRTLLYGLVLSRLDYCNALLAGQPASLLNRLQSVQNAAARLYAGVNRRCDVTTILRDELHWLKVEYRIVYKLCLLVFNCVRGDGPDYLRNYCVNPADQSVRLSRNRSAGSGNLLIPRTHLKTYGQRSFATSGPSAWNALPLELKNEPTLSTFKSKLKTHLFKLCYSL